MSCLNFFNLAVSGKFSSKFSSLALSSSHSSTVARILCFCSRCIFSPCVTSVSRCFSCVCCEILAFCVSIDRCWSSIDFVGAAPSDSGSTPDRASLSCSRLSSFRYAFNVCLPCSMSFSSASSCSAAYLNARSSGFSAISVICFWVC